MTLPKRIITLENIFFSGRFGGKNERYSLLNEYPDVRTYPITMLREATA